MGSTQQVGRGGGAVPKNNKLCQCVVSTRWCHSAHCKRVKDQCSKHVSGHLISSFGDVPWPPRSPDLSTCDFFWEYLKSRFYANNPRKLNDLKEAIRQKNSSDRSSVVDLCHGRFLKKTWKLHPRRRSPSYRYHFWNLTIWYGVL